MDTHQSTPSAAENLARLAQTHLENQRLREALRLLHQAARQALSCDDYPAALDYLDRAIALAADSRPAERFGLLFDRELLYGLRGRRDAQLRDLQSLEALAEALDDDGRRAIVAARQAEWRAADGDAGSAISLATLAARLARLSGAAGAAAQAHGTLGHVLIGQAQFDRAEFHLRRALALANDLGDNAIRAAALRHLGVLANDRERFAEALTFYVQAEALYAGADDVRSQAKVLNNRGHVHAHQGQLGQALQAWQETDRLFRKLNDLPSSIRALINLGALHSDFGQYDAAERHLQQALAQAQRIQLVPAICYAALNLGLVAERQGRYAAAVEHLDQARTIARKMGAQRLEGAILMVRGQALVGLARLAEAGDAFWEALAIWEALELPSLTAEARAGLAHIAHANNAPTLAMGFVEQILAQIARDGRLAGAESPVAIFLTCYRVLQKGGDPRADGVLRQGVALLNDRLATIVDEEARRAMRENVTAHRELLAAVAALA